MQPISQLHQQDPDVVGHRKHQFAEIFRLLGAFRKQLELRELGYAIDKAGDLGPKILLDVLNGRAGVLHGVVKERCRDRRRIELQIGENSRHFQRVREIGITRRALLRTVGLHRKHIGPIEDRFVRVRIVGADPLNQRRLTHEPVPAHAHGVVRATTDAVRVRHPRHPAKLSLPSRWRATGEALFLVISGVFGLGFGTALSFGGECPQKFLFGELPMEHIVGRQLFHWRKSFRFVHLGMTLQALDEFFPELFRFKFFAGNFTQGDHGVLVPVAIHHWLGAAGELTPAVRGQQDKVKTVGDLVDTIFNCDACHSVLVISPKSRAMYVTFGA